MDAERNEAAAGAPGTITLGGQTYLVSPATVATFLTVRKHLMKLAQQRQAEAVSPLAAIKKDLEGLSPADRAVAIQAAVAMAKPQSVEVTEDLCAEFLFSAEGCRFVAWLHLRQNHPELTQQRLAELIDEDNAADVYLQLDEATGMGRLGNRAGRRG